MARRPPSATLHTSGPAGRRRRARARSCKKQIVFASPSRAPATLPRHRDKTFQGVERMRVLVADDFPLVRDGLAGALVRDPDIEVVGLAVDGVDALEKARALRPDVIVLDLRMPRMSGLMALTHLRAEVPDARVLVMSKQATAEAVIDAVSAGAAGFVGKEVTGDELRAAVRAVARGDAAMSPELVAHLMRGLRRDSSGPGARRAGSPPASSACCAWWPRARPTSRSAGRCSSRPGRCRAICPTSGRRPVSPGARSSPAGQPSTR
jgi:DNA-binding NarL/FixJ family response regulator